MVSFSCEVCNDTVLKKKLDAHKQRCNGAYFTCIDCSVTFNGTDYRGHTSCISEAQKYEKGLYKGKKKEPKPEPKDVKSEPKHPKSETNESKPEKAKKSDTKKSEKQKTKKADKSDFVSSKPQSLYKVIKKMEKKDKKHFLERIHVFKGDDGQLKVSVKY